MQLISLIIGLIILFGVPYLIGKYFFSDKASDKAKKILFFITFPMILLMTACLIITPLDDPGTGWLVILFFPIDILFWFIQVHIIKMLYKKDKYMRWYWFYNSLSPFWLIWLKITLKSDIGYFLYVIGALLIVLFVLKRDPLKQNPISKENV